MTNDPTESGITSVKAFKRRTILGTALKISLVLLLLAGLALGVLALFFKDTWRDMRGWATDRLEDTRTVLFDSLATKYIDESDLKDADRNAWKDRVKKMCVIRDERRGSDEQRKELEVFFNKIAEAMEDNEIRSAELQPLQQDLTALLDDIEKTDKIKQG